tara:strand:+ start:1103 stop:1432 length:330 start_codon:yes stop_codon:yes gene_type:complete
MAFFDNPIIRAESVQLFEVYQRLVDLSARGTTLNNEDKIEYLEKVARVIELQKVLYFRAKYSEEDDAFEFIQYLKQSARLLGYDNGDVDECFVTMQADVERAIDLLENG